MSPAIREIIDGYVHLGPREREMFRQLLDGMRVEDISDLRKRAGCADRKAFKKFLAASPDVPPIPGDEL